jgi:hypothetical protein
VAGDLGWVEASFYGTTVISTGQLRCKSV